MQNPEDSSKRSASNSEKKESKPEEAPELHMIKPKPTEKFRPVKIRQTVKEYIKLALEDLKEFDTDTAQNTCKMMSSSLKDKLKNLKYNRYKYIVQVSIGEKKGQGVRMVNRCFWDSETDNVIVETYMNDKIFCTVTVYGIYCY